MYKLALGVATLALSAGAASAQWVYPDYGYAPYGYGYAGYGYGAPLYDYAGGYAAPATTTGTTVIIVTPGSGYAAPRVASGYYNYHRAIGAAVTGAPAIGAATDTAGARESLQTRHSLDRYSY